MGRDNGIVIAYIEAALNAIGIDESGNGRVSLVIHAQALENLRTLGDLLRLLENKKVRAYTGEEEENMNEYINALYIGVTAQMGRPPQHSVIKIDTKKCSDNPVLLHDFMCMGFESVDPRILALGSIWDDGSTWQKMKDLPLTLDYCE